MRKITDELLMQLRSASDMESFFKTNESSFIDMTANDFLCEMLETKGISMSDVAKKSGAGEYVYKIFKGERKASRDVLISIAFGMGLTLEETQLLLRISKFAVLDSREKRDSIIIFCLTRSKDIFETDDILEENGFATVAK